MIIKLKRGEIKRLSDRLLVEKTLDGKIILYEVIDEQGEDNDSL